MAATIQGVLTRIFKQNDIMFASFFISIIIVMILPLPAFLLDLLLTVSITFSVIILMVAIYADEPLQFSTFPSVLLVITLFRLALNVATTRRILLYGASGEGAAGNVIQAFGQFVVGGNYIVGIIIFLILVLINFMVITKGSTRIAEVAARFTLDAMPGKQMSIDADLNAGIIDEITAKKKRETIQKEADYYGAMDGASKFVRGDAVAGLIVTAINIIGGLLIGSLQQGLPLQESAGIFTILTIGDGLVTQIPSLIVSTAAGIIVSRAGGESDLSGQLVNQLFTSTKVLSMTGGILLFFSLIPGLPKLSFMVIAAMLFGIVYATRKAVAPIDEKAEDDEEEPDEERDEKEEVRELLDMDTMELEIGFSLIPLVDSSQGGTLLTRIKAIRKQIALEMGIIVPPVRIRDNLQLDGTGYVVLLKGVKVASGTIMPDRFMVMNPEGELSDIDGIPTKEPAFGLEAKWVDEAQKEKAELQGYTIVDPATVVATHLTEVIKSNSYELLGRQETQELLDRLREKYPKLVEDLVPNILDLGTVNRVLQNLLRERVSIRNLQSILEVLASYGVQNKDVPSLVEKVRYALRRQITESLLAPDGTLYVFTLPSNVEQFIAQNLQQGDDGKEILIDPSVAQKILSEIMKKSDEVAEKGYSPVLVVSPPLRYSMRKFVEKFINNINVISHNEISDNVRIESLGMLEIKL
ncbi:flagellar biosynthesis protein FlhA [Limisalsivibrio acetivorans]|uniref:flagellar biosynthesis protein FlhA n=1 Tax=Limisalsivibrio acetivorans TaxID=1304888 RepID=UPI0003B4FC0C|nr:flagellar biosynthesis protein FlhA [Limisalsivibrio acetivorans]